MLLHQPVLLPKVSYIINDLINSGVRVLFQKRHTALLYLLLFPLLVACSSSHDGQKVDEHVQTDHSQAESSQAVDYVMSKNEITDAVAVNTKETILLAYDVQQMDRFRLDEIKKDVKKELETQFPDKKIALSFDKKIMLEVTELQNKMAEKEMNDKKVKKEIQKIEKLMKEKT